MTVILLDADVTIYRGAVLNQVMEVNELGKEVPVGDLESAKQYIDDTVGELCGKFRDPELIMCLSHHENFRKKINPDYKANRKGKPKPVLIGDLRAYVEENYVTRCEYQLEADDILGILSTDETYRPDDVKVVVSIDKDMQSFPGWLFNPDKDDEPRQISTREADRYHLKQTLTGDSTDGYKGCLGIGPKRAEEAMSEAVTWSKVLEVYSTKGQMSDEALMNARMARILRAGDYDFITGEVKLWEPGQA